MRADLQILCKLNHVSMPFYQLLIQLFILIISDLKKMKQIFLFNQIMDTKELLMIDSFQFYFEFKEIFESITKRHFLMTSSKRKRIHMMVLKGNFVKYDYLLKQKTHRFCLNMNRVGSPLNDILTFLIFHFYRISVFAS